MKLNSPSFRKSVRFGRRPLDKVYNALGKWDWIVITAVVLSYGVGDTASTIAVLSVGGYETNPTVVQFIKVFGPVLGLVVNKSAALILFFSFVTVHWKTLEWLDADSVLPGKLNLAFRYFIPVYVIIHGLRLAIGNVQVMLSVA